MQFRFENTESYKKDLVKAEIRYLSFFLMVLRITQTRECREEHRRNMWVRCGRIREVVNSDGVGRLGEVWITDGRKMI